MQFYDATNKRAICQEIDRICDTTDTSYPRADKTARVNDAAEQVAGWLINSDGRWQWDDSAYTDFPIGTYTLVNAQKRYSFNDKFLQLDEVSVKNKNGDFQILRPIDQKEYSDLIPLAEAYETNGMPYFYDKVSDDTIDLYPGPDNGVSVTLASGLKIKFKRTAKLFTVATDTSADTTVPGFASPYHVILAWMASRPYCMLYKKDRVAELNALIGDTTSTPTGMKKDLLAHYGRRERDARKKATMRGINFR